MLTWHASTTAAVRALAHGATRDCWLLDSPYSAFRFRSAHGAELDVACHEIGIGPTDAAAEVGRLSVLHPDAVLLLLGQARPARGTAGADLIVGELLVEPGVPGGRTQVVRASPDLAAVARRLSRAGAASNGSRARPGRAVVGALCRDEAALPEAGQRELPVLAIEEKGHGFASALSGSGRMKRLVVCDLRRNVDQQGDPISSADGGSAVAFAFAVLEEQLRLLDLEAPEHGPDPAEGLVDPVPAGDEELSMAGRAAHWIDAVAVDPPPLEDDGVAAAAMARSDFLSVNSLFFYELVYEVAGRIDDVAQTWAGRSLRAYGRECARAMASLCDVAPVPAGSPADMTVRFPIEEMLQRSPVGAAVMLSVPEAWRCLDFSVRDRILCALSGPFAAPHPPTEIGWLCLLALVSARELAAADWQRVARAVVSSSYDLLARVRAPLPLVRDKALADLVSGVATRQDLAARYLYRDGARLSGQLSVRDDYEVGRQLHTASRAGSHGATEALARTNLTHASAARRAGVLMASLLIDDRYLRLELPAGERRVLAASSLAGDLADVLAIAAARLPPPVGSGELAGYLAHDTVDRLQSLALELPDDEALLWAEFVEVLRQRV